MYKAVPVVNGMIGGHYAIEKPNGRVVGQDLALDFTRANMFANMLNDAYQSGLKDRAKGGQ